MTVATTNGAQAPVLDVGLYPDIPFPVYLADPCPEPSLSSSTIRTIWDRSPEHAQLYHPRFGGMRSESSRAELGTAAHAALLGGDERVLVVEADDWRTARAREQRDAARAAGRVPLLAKHADALPTIVGSAEALLRANGIDLASARREWTAIWREGPLWARGRPDLMAPGVIVDVKTATNAAPGPWIKHSMLAGGYHIQAAWYLRGMEALEPVPRDFLFLVVEIEPPYACSFVGVGPELLDIAQRQVDWALAKWIECVRASTWPGYDTRVHYADCPAWLEWDVAARGIYREGKRVAAWGER